MFFCKFTKYEKSYMKLILVVPQRSIFVAEVKKIIVILPEVSTQDKQDMM